MAPPDILVVEFVVILPVTDGTEPLPAYMLLFGRFLLLDHGQKDLIR